MVLNNRLKSVGKPTKEDRDILINTEKFQKEWKKSHQPKGGCKPRWPFKKR